MLAIDVRVRVIVVVVSGIFWFRFDSWEMCFVLV